MNTFLNHPVSLIVLFLLLFSSAVYAVYRFVCWICPVEKNEDVAETKKEEKTECPHMHKLKTPIF